MSQEYVHSFIKKLLLNVPHSSHFDKWNKPVFLWVHLCRGMKLKLKVEQFHGSLVFDVNTIQVMSSPLFSVGNYLSFPKIHYQKEKLPSNIFRAWHGPKAEEILLRILKHLSSPMRLTLALARILTFHEK